MISYMILSKIRSRVARETDFIADAPNPAGTLIIRRKA